MDDDIGLMVSDIQTAFPIFKGITVADMRTNDLYSDGRKLEFYHPEDSPTGNMHIELFDNQMRGQELRNAFLGEMLHAAPSLSKHYSEQKEMLMQSMTSAQEQSHKEAYDRAKDLHGEQRPYEKWFKFSRSDAFIRGYIANQWPEYQYTEFQRRLMNQMLFDLEVEQ